MDVLTWQVRFGMGNRWRPLLNFPANSSSLRVLETLRENESVRKCQIYERVLTVAKSRGIRYWIVNMDESMMPDEYSQRCS